MNDRFVWLCAAGASLLACAPYSTILERNLVAIVSSPRQVENRIERPIRPDARLAVLWVGHATALVQIDDKVVLTDPVFTSTVAQFSRRLVEPGIDPEHLPPIDAVLVSHMHVDHLSLGTLELLEAKIRRLYVPSGGLVYIPNHRFPTHEVRRWESDERDGLRVTAVPVDHAGYRYGLDAAWMKDSFTGWVVEYHGVTVYFAGDTAYEQALFQQTAARFPGIDLAILPIGPVEPHELARKNHIDGREAVQVLLDLDARHMVPVHHDTFPHGTDPPGHALRVLEHARREARLATDRIHPLAIGEQVVILPR